MEPSVSKSEEAVNFVLGVFFVVAGIICLLLSFSFLPLIGFFIGVPCIAIGILFLVKHKRRLTARRRPQEEL